MVDLVHFNQNEFIEGEDLQERFGLRGRNMMQLAQLKAPIAPGFLIDSTTLQGGLKENLTLPQLEGAIKKIEALTDKTFNAATRPMLLKVVVSPSIQIGSISSVHTIGINDEVAKGFAGFCGEEFAYSEYEHFMEQIGQRFLGKNASDFKSVKESNPNASPKEVCALYREKVVPDFPQSGYEQLRMVLASIAEQFLADPMNEGIETGLLVQMMVYGNFGENSYNGDFYSRDIVTGEPRLSGFFGHNEFDTLPGKGEDINNIKSEYLEQLQKVAGQLEENFLDIRQIKFVIEDSRFWLVEQNPVDAKSTQAEIRTLLDLNKKGLVDNEKMVKAVPPNQLQDLLHPVIDHDTTRELAAVVGGLAGSPGATVGRVAFSTPALLEEYRRCSIQGINSDLILVMAHTDAEDVEAIEMGSAVIASIGGYASHAPVVARSLRKPCLVYEDIQYNGDHIIMNGNRINEFDTISMEVPTYTDPTVWIGKADLVYPDTSRNGLEDFIGALNQFPSSFRVLGTASNINDVKVAMRLGAEGIGQFPCDALLLHPETLAAFQEALLIGDPEKRKAALATTSKLLETSILEILDLVAGKEICFKLLEGPLVEFLPHSSDEEAKVYGDLNRKHPEVSVEDFKARAGQLRNVNPMMGLRGSRIAISYPDLYETQVAAIFRAATAFTKKGGPPLKLDIMIPAVMGDAEMRFIRHGRSIESTVILGVTGMERQLLKELGVEKLPFNYRVGAVIELPAAALMAGHLAKQSDFFNIDIDMLTQTTNGMSADDINLFLPSYTQYDILKDNPFQILSMPVKELIGSTVHFGKITRPDLQIGMAGVHASDPANIEFALRSGLNFVSCSPFGVPIAKLAVTQRGMTTSDGRPPA